MASSPYDRLLLRLADIHTSSAAETCFNCGTAIPCDTMRSLWIYDLETRQQAAE